MRYITPYLFILLGLMLISPAVMAAPDAKPSAIGTAPPVPKSPATDAGPASQPAGADKPDNLPGTNPPSDVAGGIDTGKTLWQAVKDKAWWLVAACGIFLVMLILELTGMFKKMGKRVTWIVAGVLSFAAALCLAFDKSGFSWEAFLAFSTAGPTVAWLRGFVKKVVLNFQTKESG